MCEYFTPTGQPIPTNSGLSSQVADVINYAKLHVDQLKGFDWRVGKRGRPQHGAWRCRACTTVILLTLVG